MESYSLYITYYFMGSIHTLSVLAGVVDPELTDIDTDPDLIYYFKKIRKRIQVRILVSVGS